MYRRPISWSLFILLLTVLLGHIQIRGQKLSYEVKNELIKTRLLVKSTKGKILDKALTFRLAFLIIPSRS